MNEERSYSASAMLEGDDSIWWITGGTNGNYLDSTEVFSVNDSSFTFGVNLPKKMYVHNLVNVNQTHMVLLGGEYTSDEVYITDRYTYYCIQEDLKF